MYWYQQQRQHGLSGFVFRMIYVSRPRLVILNQEYFKPLVVVRGKLLYCSLSGFPCDCWVRCLGFGDGLLAHVSLCLFP